MNRNLWLTVALILGAVAIWCVVFWQPAARTAEETGVVTPVAEQPAAVPPPAQPQPSARPNVPDDMQAPDPPAKPPTQQAAPAPEEMIPAPERTGPVEERKAAFASEPRDSHATEPESAIQAVFRRPEVPSGLLKSVLCRASVCKVETRWTPARAEGFMGAFMNLVASPDGAPSRKFDHEIAIAPDGAPDSNGERAIDVYLKRIDVSP